MINKSPKLKKHNSSIAFEISESCVIVVEVKSAKDRTLLTGGFRLDIPVFKDINNTVALIKQSLKHSNIKSKEAAFGFSMQYFKFFPVAMPKSIPASEVGSIILQEGNIDSASHSVSYLSLANTERKDADGVVRSDVLGISIPNQYIHFATLLCKQCGLNPALVTPSFLGLSSYLEKSISNQLVSTLWISQIRSEFVVWSGHDPVYEHLFLSHQINEQIFQSVNYVQTQLAGSQVSKIFTSGPYAKEVNLSQVPFNVQAFSLPNNITDANNVLQKISPSEAIQSIGLACIVIGYSSIVCPNLLYPVSEGIKHKAALSSFFTANLTNIKLPFLNLKSFGPQLSRFVSASVFVFFLSFFLYFVINNFLISKGHVKQLILENKIVLAQSHLAQVSNYEKTNKLLNLKINYFSNLIEKRKEWSQILKEIAEMTPKGLWIDRLEMTNNNVDVFGRALTVDSVANFSINLNYNAKLLSNAQIISLSKNQEEGIDIVEFQINVKFKDNLALASLKEQKSKSKSQKNI